MIPDGAPPRVGTGLVLGKFLPPHRGHRLLVDFARASVTDVTVLVCSLAREEIPGALRHAWMAEEFPSCRVVHVTDENPQEPHEHPRFWEIWRETVRRHLPTGPDVVFTSEAYGDPLAQALGAEHVAVDPDRVLVPTSGTAVRADPMARFDDLLPAARPWFVRRVCVAGPESTGKTTLARALADRYRTAWVPEYGRAFLDRKGAPCAREDIPHIARGQVASEDAAARAANRVLVCDTDLLATVFWSETFFGDCPAWIRAEADRRRYDLTILTDIDVPFEADWQRHLPHAREAFLARCEGDLVARGRAYVKVSGPHERRLSQACAAIDGLLRRGPATPGARSGTA